jgi:spermidine/putrescine transport system permease protein
MRRRPAWLLALPAWAWYVAWFLIPVAIVGVYSFGRRGVLADGETDNVILSDLSFDRYREAVREPFGVLLRLTLETSVIGTVICFIIALPAAYAMATKFGPRGRTVALALVIIPFWTSFLLRTYSWTILLTSRGVLSERLQIWGIRDTPIEVLGTRTAVQIGVVYNYLPLMVFPLFVAFDRLEPSLREAARDLGAGRFRTFFGITMPLSKAGITSGLLLVFVPLMGDFVTAEVLGKAKGTMIGQSIYGQFLDSGNWALGSAMSVLLILLIAATVMTFALAVKVTTLAFAGVRSVRVPEVGT